MKWLVCALLAMTLWPAMALADQSLDDRMKLAREKNYLRPRVSDLSAYSQPTIDRVKERVAQIDDPCIAAVEMALFLDMRRNETGVEALMEEVENPWMLALDIAAAWGTPDKPEIGARVIDGLLWQGAKRFSHLSTIDNLGKTADAIDRHFTGTVASRRGRWAYEIWRQAQDMGWSDAEMVAMQRDMVAESQASLALIHEAAESLDRKIVPVHLTHGQRMIEIERRHQDRLDAIMVEAGGDRFRMDEPAFVLKRADARNAFVAEKQAELQRYQDHENQVIAEHDRRISAELAKIARLQIQREALERYARPVRAGDCAQVTQKRKPRPVGPAQDRHDDPVVSPILGLPNEQMLKSLAELGITPSEDYLSCVCRAAGYGSPQTSQYYHPDTIDEYDARYSCNKPGPPCIVSGFGCMRYPMPARAATWDTCGAVNGAEGGPTMTETVRAGLAARAATAPGQQGPDAQGATTQGPATSGQTP